MADKLSVLNVALGLCGEKEAQDLASLGNQAAKVHARLDDARRNVLERHGWIDALDYATLQPAADLSNWKYSTGYWLPKGALRVWELPYDPACLKWQEATTTDADGATRRLVWTNGVGALNLSYVRDAKWEALGPTLAKAVAFEAAALAAFHVTGDQGLADKLAERARTARLEAASVDSMREGGQDVVIPDPVYAMRAGAM